MRAGEVICASAISGFSALTPIMPRSRSTCVYKEHAEAKVPHRPDAAGRNHAVDGFGERSRPGYRSVRPRAVPDRVRLHPTGRQFGRPAPTARARLAAPGAVALTGSIPRRADVAVLVPQTDARGAGFGGGERVRCRRVQPARQLHLDAPEAGLSREVRQGA